VDVLLKINASLATPEIVLIELAALLRRESSWVRPVRAPRFQLMRAKLNKFRGRDNRQAEAMGVELERALRIGGGIAEHVTGAPLGGASALAKPIVWLRQVWLRLGLTRASRWVLQYTANFDPGVYNQHELKVCQKLERGLVDAMAADLTHATSRRLCRVDKIVLFFDAYDSIEESAARAWLREFAEALHANAAKVMLVVTCRHQRVWAEMISKREPQDYGVFKASDRVEIHTLEGLDDEERTYALAQFLVPPTLAPQLAEISAGHPMSLHLLGAAFGGARPDLDQAEKGLAERFPPPKTVTEAWVKDITEAVGEELIGQLKTDLLQHARAAATLRFFDRELLEHVMEDAFNSKCFNELAASPLVALWQPSPITDPTGESTYRLRGFARLILEGPGRNTPSTEAWHRRAERYFAKRKQMRSASEHSKQLAGTEELFHRLAVDRARGEKLIWSTFLSELRRRRFDLCETLLQVANDLNWLEQDWNVRRLMMMGRMGIALGDYKLAERRLTEACDKAPLRAGAGQLQFSVAQSLARCLRLQSRVTESREVSRLIYRYSDHVPIMRFQAVWTDTLLDKECGDLKNATVRADNARRYLDRLLVDDPKGHSEAAARHGLGALELKPCHLERHRADLARRSGDYAQAHTHLSNSRTAALDVDAEPHIEAYTMTVESHLLRLENDFDSARARGSEALERFVARPDDWRGLGQAQRAIGQAELVAADPDRAMIYFEELLSADPRIFPSGQAVAHFGIGEIKRRNGDREGARVAYTKTQDSPVFERCYGSLALAEMAITEGVYSLALTPLSAYTHDSAFQAHPILAFWHALICARSEWLSGTSLDTADNVNLERARNSLGRICRRPDAPPESIELTALQGTEAALREGEALPSIVFNLP
jgi:tetratricopeptide (TPR) repeat protein